MITPDKGQDRDGPRVLGFEFTFVGIGNIVAQSALNDFLSRYGVGERVPCLVHRNGFAALAVE
jgi:hypothetical protein